MGSLHNLLTIGLGAAGLILGAATAQAAPVFISNHSFEAHQFASAGQYESGVAPDGWTTSGSIEVGIWRPEASSFGTVPDGNNIGYVWGGGALFQELETELAANTHYTLSFEYGRRASLLPGDSQSFDVQLYAGNDVLTEALSQINNLEAGTWATFTLEFTSLATVAPGQKLGILLGNAGHSAYFDNIRLDAVALDVPPVETPEPAALALLGLGVVGLGCIRRRKA